MATKMAIESKHFLDSLGGSTSSRVLFFLAAEKSMENYYSELLFGTAEEKESKFKLKPYQVHKLFSYQCACSD